MNGELTNLNKKIRLKLIQRKLPDEIKSTVENIFQEYKALYEQNMKDENALSEQYVAFGNVDKYFEDNKIEASRRINNEYEEKCIDIAETVTMVLTTFEPQKSIIKDEEIEKSEIDVLNRCVLNDRENYRYVERITKIVIDAIENSKSQWFRTLEGLRTSEQKKEYIYSQIKLIENSAKLKLNSLKECLGVDNKQILEQILEEYETYKENKQKNGELKQDAHQKFIEEYKVSEEELQNNARITQNEVKQVEQDKEYEDGLPGNVIE